MSPKGLKFSHWLLESRLYGFGEAPTRDTGSSFNWGPSLAIQKAVCTLAERTLKEIQLDNCMAFRDLAANSLPAISKLSCTETPIRSTTRLDMELLYFHELLFSLGLRVCKAWDLGL